MIFKVFPSPADLENLSRITTKKCAEAGTFDYRSVVVNKPWGYEYLWYQNEFVAAWMLHLKEGCSTSLHCHIQKRTSLIVIDGNATCSTLEDRFRLSALDSMVLESGVFHSTQATSPQGAFVLEIETPVMKGDLVRLKDSFGRQGTGYEGVSQYSQDFSKYEYQPFQILEAAEPARFRKMNFALINSSNTAHENLLPRETSIFIPMRKPLILDKMVIADTAEAILAKKYVSHLNAIAQGIELLHIQHDSI